MTFGERLRQARVKRRYTQIFLAKKVGISRTAYQGYEYDLVEPSFFIVCCLSEALNVSLNYLAGRSDK